MSELAEETVPAEHQVRDSRDRYANLEIGYLLQRMEDHEGVVFLATNRRRNINDAFSRRLKYVDPPAAARGGARARLTSAPQSPLGPSAEEYSRFST